MALTIQLPDFVFAKLSERAARDGKSVELLAPLHHAQLLSYMRVARKRAGLLMNFNVAVLKDGLARKIL